MSVVICLPSVHHDDVTTLDFSLRSVADRLTRQHDLLPVEVVDGRLQSALRLNETTAMQQKPRAHTDSLTACSSWSGGVPVMCHFTYFKAFPMLTES